MAALYYFNTLAGFGQSIRDGFRWLGILTSCYTARMTLSVPLRPDTEARLRQLAQEAGKDMASYVSELVEEAAARSEVATSQTAVEFDSALDELFAGDTRKLPSLPLTFTRDDIYTDHD